MDHSTVREYYGEVLGGTEDLKTNACCDAEAPPEHIRALLGDIHPDVSARFYGCGLVAPTALEGLTVLDLGCGSGRDVYLLSRMVGETGQVIGVDMTEAQLTVARSALDWQTERYGYAQPNVRFESGVIEDLGALDVAPGSVDLIVSNCVVNLATDKLAVLRGAYEMLKPGGEVYFSDVYADRRIPEALRRDPVLYGECLSGALYTRDFLSIAAKAGFAAPRRVSTRGLSVGDDAVQQKLGDIGFVSEVWRLFKQGGLETTEEDYGQRVVYRGGLLGEDAVCVLDEAHRFPKGVPVAVSGNTWTILQGSRYTAFFDFLESDGTHRGGFNTEPASSAEGSACAPSSCAPSSCEPSTGCC
ncbi:MAG: methyltransferase domain-containing protein [Pseudomonadota bacterium]